MVAILRPPSASLATDSELAAEQEAREDADTALTQAIADEATARANADTALSTSVAGKVSKADNLSDLVDVEEAKDNLSLVKADVGLSNVDNTSDANKPVSTAQSAALATKADAAALTAEVETREAVAGQLELVGKYGLRRWRVALADALFARAVISCFGDSITTGSYANNATSSTDPAKLHWRQRGWVGQLRSLLALTYGDAGEGYLAAGYAHEDRIVQAGNAAGASTIGPLSYGVSIRPDVGAGAGTLTYTLTCDAFDIVAWANTGSTANFSFTVDGGAPVTVSQPAGLDTLWRHSVTGLTYGAHTVVLTGPATLRADIAGVISYRGTSGVMVNRFGYGGEGVRKHATAGASGARVMRSSYEETATDLAIFMWGYNDWANQPGHGTGVLADVPTFKSTLTAQVQSVAGYGGCSLLLPDPHPTLDLSRPYDIPDYDNALREIAEENDHVAFCNFNDVWGTYEQANAAGMRQDTIHPNRKGHGDIARLIYSIITRPDLGEAA